MTSNCGNGGRGGGSGMGSLDMGPMMRDCFAASAAREHETRALLATGDRNDSSSGMNPVILNCDGGRGGGVSPCGCSAADSARARSRALDLVRSMLRYGSDTTLRTTTPRRSTRVIADDDVPLDARDMKSTTRALKSRQEQPNHARYR